MIEFKLDLKSSVTFDQQIVDQVFYGMATGYLKSGEQLPAASNLAEQLNINLDIVNKAYQKLESQKITELHQTRDKSCFLFLREKEITFIFKFLLKILYKISKNHLTQRLLEKIVESSQYLMGIGSGGSVSTSGERVVIDVLSSKFKPPYCIFDAGANRGSFLNLILENIVTENFLIHCFEPGVTTFQFLESNSRGDKRIKLNNLGLGKEKKEMTLYYDAPGSSRASLTKMNREHINININQSEQVEIETLDNYCLENSIDRIHLLKMDIEGHELEALAGATQMFEKNAIDIVTFELGKCNVSTRYFFKDFYDFFQKFNMQIFRITPSEYLYPIQSYKEIHEQFRTTNFMAIKNG